MTDHKKYSLLDKLIRFCLENKLIVFLGILFVVVWGSLVAPFDWNLGGLPRDPVSVDAIPDIGENQQIVFTQWMGRSPQDVEDQITYPMTTALLGIPKVKTVRSFSFFGFSSIYVIFEEDAEFYWSRSRVLEKLNSLPTGMLPQGVQPALGPDATALGQIFWYTLEGLDPDGQPTGGWDLQELRSVQDWQVRYALTAAKGVSEVASIGGFVKEYQVDVDPDAMRSYGVKLQDIFKAIKMSNIDVGAKTIEVNKVEYFIRGLGFIKNVEDIENTVVKVNDNTPIYVKNMAQVVMGPQMRRGALDKGGAEAVGAVAVVRYGFNPLEAIKNIKSTIKKIAPGLPKKPVIDFEQINKQEVENFALTEGFAAYKDGVLYKDAWMEWLNSHPRKEWPKWATISQVSIVPFYDRTILINETLGTLNSALIEEILVTIIVVIIMVLHVRSSLLISSLLPLAVLICFIAMKLFNVDANIVALSGIAIAIGTMVDMGIIICENILKHLDAAPPDEKRLEVIYRATSEVGSAIVTSVTTTIISFLPVFAMEAAEGKLFKPLAFTKTFALAASVVVALVVIPPLSHLLFSDRSYSERLKKTAQWILVAAGIYFVSVSFIWVGVLLMSLGLYYLCKYKFPHTIQMVFVKSVSYIVAVVVALVLAKHWAPLGHERDFGNIVFVLLLIGTLIVMVKLFLWSYEPILRWCLRNKFLFLSFPILIVISGLYIWKDMGKEFMPALDEGSYLLMPSTMPHASIGESMDVLHKQGMAIKSIPEVKDAVGKIGRVESSLDPAPVSMIETVITYKSEYIVNKKGDFILYKYDKDKKEFVKDNEGKLIPEKSGRAFRQWRPHIKNPDDIWNNILKAAKIPGTTSAPKLQPIAARIVMLQSGMRAPMGLKVYGPDLKTIDKAALQIEKMLKSVPSIEPETVVADRVVGKPYIEIDINRESVARYGLHIEAVQDVIEVAIGGKTVTTTVEGRERYSVRVRYARELRDDIESLERILVPTPDGVQIPLEQLAEVKYVQGPQAIKSEDTELVAYVVFDMKPGFSEVDVVEKASEHLIAMEASKQFIRPKGVTYKFSGNYENQIRAEKRLFVLLPLSLFLILIVLYLQFRSIITSMLIFFGVLVAWSGGFIMLWLYGQDWFLNVTVFDINFRELFHVKPYNLSVAVWVGFLALFGLADDDGVVISTYLKQRFDKDVPDSIESIRECTVQAGKKRIRPCLMTSATTILALIPVLTSTGRGSDVMTPMAIPSFGGMTVVWITVFVVPVFYCLVEEIKFKMRKKT